MPEKHLGFGVFPDVAVHNGRVWVAWQHGEGAFLVSLEFDTLRELSHQAITLGPNAGAFCKLHAEGGRLWLVYREGEPEEHFQLLEVGTANVRDLGIGRGHGNDAALVGRGYVFWQSTPAPAYRVRRRPLVGTEPPRDVRDGAPTGLSRVVSEQEIRLVDEDRAWVSGMTRPAWAGDCVVGEYHRSANNGVLARLADMREVVLWPAQESFTPRVAWDGGDRFVCVTWGNVGVRLAQVARAEFHQPQPDKVPIEDTSGQLVDLWAYFIPSVPGAFPRTSGIPTHGHEMHCVFDGRNVWDVRFGGADHWVRLVVEGDTLTLREDHSRDGQSTGAYSFTRGLWARRYMRPGDRIANLDNTLVRYSAAGCEVVDVHAFPFRTGLWKRWLQYDCGGDLGWQDVVAYLYDPGGLSDSYELAYYARGYGLFRWEEYNQRTNGLNHWTTFNEFGGRAPSPTPGCWRREHLSLTPENWPPKPAPDPPPPPAMKVSFRTSSGVHFLCAEGSGGHEVNATRTVAGPWEEFEVVRVEDGIALKTASGHFVCAEGGGGGALNANRSAVGP